jgi:lipid-binding SYLF domain-containing protein
VLLSIANLADAASKEEIDAEVRAALVAFKQQASAGHELSQKASGMLVFPNVVKGSFIVGGEFGDGALLIDGKTVGYYNIAAASIGLQLGAQARSEVILFMTEKALKDFQRARAGRSASTAAWRSPLSARAARSIPRPRASR